MCVQTFCSPHKSPVIFVLEWVSVPGWVANMSDHMILEKEGYVLLIRGITKYI